jgi:hypothetical protein
MKKIFIILLIMAVGVSPVATQNLQYFMQRSSSNVASASEVQTLQAFICGSQSMQGFEGSPKNALFDVVSPLSFGGSKQNNRGWNTHTSRRSNEQIRNFVKATISHESLGVHSDFRAILGYNFRMFVSETASITFGLGGGVKSFNSNYNKWESGIGEYDKKETSFDMQMGVRFEADRLNVSAFTNAENYFGEIVWGRLWDGGGGENVSDFWGDMKEKNWHGQFAILGKHNSETKISTIRVSAQAVYRDGLGVGISYQTDKNLSANVSLRFTKYLRIGYAYQLMAMNPMAKKHEIVVRYRFVRDVEY